MIQLDAAIKRGKTAAARFYDMNGDLVGDPHHEVRSGTATRASKGWRSRSPPTVSGTVGGPVSMLMAGDGG
jgi:hypothetical protein